MRLADGVEYQFWTFGGQVPGQMIRVREGDTIEVQFSNHPDSKCPIMLTFTLPQGLAAGQKRHLPHRVIHQPLVLKPYSLVLYVYHCAVAPVGMHIANGMYGLILVEPKEGLPK